MDARKVSDTSIEITTQVPQPAPIVRTYQRSFIEQQIKDITAQRDAYTAARQAELDECNEILKAMDDAGIVAVKPKEEVVDGTIG